MAQMLIIDNSAVIRRVGQCVFEELGFKSYEASNQDEAITICSNQMPDLIVVDENALDSTLVQFTNFIRSLENEIEPRFILSSIIIDETTYTKGHMAGIEGYLFKPFTRKTVAQLLADMQNKILIRSTA